MNSRRVARSLRVIAAEFAALADEIAPPETVLEVHEPELEPDEIMRRSLQALNEIELRRVFNRVFYPIVPRKPGRA